MWSPLKEPVFRALWIAAFVSNIGSLMQDVAAAWLMTSMTTEPLMVALLQTAVNIPYFLLSLLAGAIADVIDRRKLLIWGQAWMGAAALALGVMTLSGTVNPWSLLAFTFLLGLGAAVSGPAWHAIIPELVERPQLEQAIALGSVGYNLARGLGSATGGLMVAAGGPAFVFIFNGVSFAGIIGVMAWWKRKPDEHAHVRGEKLLGAIRAGMRFARHSIALQNVFVKTAIWAIGSSALWALIPLIAREKLHLDAVQYGLLLSAFGVGTLLGAFLLPRIRKEISLEATAVFGICVWTVFSGLMAWPLHFALAALYMVALGAAWVGVNSCLNVGTQLSVPSWVRGRALAIYILIFQGCAAIGACIWGLVGNKLGIGMSLMCGSLWLSIGMLAGARFHLGVVEKLDTTPSNHWKDPTITYHPEPDHGPVLVTVEYFIEPEHSNAFKDAMHDLSIQRKRDGAFQWHLFCDLSNPKRYVEMFMIESWGEHVRQHERVMNADRAVEDAVRSFHQGSKVHHMISAYAMDISAEVTQRGDR